MAIPPGMGMTGLTGAGWPDGVPTGCVGVWAAPLGRPGVDWTTAGLDVGWFGDCRGAPAGGCVMIIGVPGNGRRLVAVLAPGFDGPRPWLPGWSLAATARAESAMCLARAARAESWAALLAAALRAGF